MGTKDVYAKPISFKELLQYKALAPMSASAVEELENISRLNVTGYYEQEVRTFIVDPIVRLLGYVKETDFSVDLGRPIEFLGKKKFPDYKFHLWKENFWLIEAKRPLPENKDAFGYEAVAQAIEYAIHPDINAALVVLCDGLILEIFDREVSLAGPVLHVDIAKLHTQFDNIRALLEPMQVWFFQKRRIVRLIDKVFDKEFNLERVEEFRALIESRLTNKRSSVLENFRRNVKPDFETRKEAFRAAPVAELVDVHCFFEHSIPLAEVLIDSLVDKCTPNSFQVLYKIFPDGQRDMNDIYASHAAMFLIALSERRTSVEWLPAWLAQGQQSNASTLAAARYFLKLCLNNFEGDEPRKLILLAAASIRRIFKLMFLGNEALWRMGNVMHFLARYQAEELSWTQIMSSPEGHVVGMMDGRSIAATQQFVTDCRAQRGEFKIEVGKLQLRHLWELEKQLLKAHNNYPKLRAERSLGDGGMAEAAALNYDLMGHNTLCLLSRFPKWITYALEEHRSLIEKLASMNSWKARELLGFKLTDAFPRATDADFAERFFYGDVATQQTLQEGYFGTA